MSALRESHRHKSGGGTNRSSRRVEDPALRQRTYNNLSTEIVGRLGTEEHVEGQAKGPTGGGAGTSPPHQKSAMEALLGETFAGKEVKDKKPFADAIEEEVA
ncbi:unnamed protein product [Arctogadus glacialis]